jgi:hypothetical protein
LPFVRHKLQMTDADFEQFKKLGEANPNLKPHQVLHRFNEERIPLPLSVGDSPNSVAKTEATPLKIESLGRLEYEALPDTLFIFGEIEEKNPDNLNVRVGRDSMGKIFLPAWSSENGLKNYLQAVQVELPWFCIDTNMLLSCVILPEADAEVIVQFLILDPEPTEGQEQRALADIPQVFPLESLAAVLPVFRRITKMSDVHVSCFKKLGDSNPNLKPYQVFQRFSEIVAEVAGAMTGKGKTEISNEAVEFMALSAHPDLDAAILRRKACPRCGERACEIEFSPSKVSAKMKCLYCGNVIFVKADDSEDSCDSGRLPIPKSVQREVWQRDRGRCVECGSRENIEFDHIIPVSRGGANTTRNIQLLCQTCNRLKTDRPPGHS